MPYFPPSHPDYNGLRHLLLMYGDRSRPWSERELRHSVAHLRADGTPDDWFFDSILFLNVKAGSGRDYVADVNRGTTMSGEGDFFAVCSPQPADKSDWEELLDFTLGPKGSVSELDRTITTCAQAIGIAPTAKRNVVLMLPYPHITQRAFGPLRSGSASLDFSIASQNLARAAEQRLEAERWFVDEIVQRFRKLPVRHVHLLGVYWMFETVFRSWEIDDHWLLKELSGHIRGQNLKFFWIPFWSSYNVHLLDDYQSYYFDIAFLQPNYMFYRHGKTLKAAADAARARNAGLEMEYYLELNEPIAVEGERHRRFREYLDGGVTYGYMTESACTHFQGVGALERMRIHADKQEREFYEDIYTFVKGTYRLKGPLR